MKRLMYITILMTVILAGCSNNKEIIEEDNVVERKVGVETTEENDDEKDDTKEKKRDEEKTTAGKEETSNHESEDQADGTLNIVEGLTVQEVVALAIFDEHTSSWLGDDYDTLIPTANNYLSGELKKIPMLGPEEVFYTFDEIGVIKTPPDDFFITEPPYDTELYTIRPYPSIPQYIAIGEEKALLFVTGGFIDYNTINNNEYIVELDIKELYGKYGNDPRFNELADMMTIYESKDDYPHPDIIRRPYVPE